MTHSSTGNTLISEQNEVLTSMDFSYESKPWQSLYNQIKNYNKRDGIDLSPDYQRDFVWINEFKDKLLYSIIRRYPIGNVCIRIRRDKNNKGAMQEVVDGQQRLTTIFHFVTGQHNIQGEYARKIIEYIIVYLDGEEDKKTEILKKKLNNKGKIVLKYEQLPEIIQDNINAYNISITNVTNASDEEVSEYFRFLQNQEILRAGEIINSIPQTVLEKYLEMLNDRKSLLSKLSFSDNRRQFDRIFYSILGLLNGNIGFGIVDKQVLDFAAKCKELEPLTIKQCMNILNNLNSLTENIKIPSGYIKANARYMKFLLLLTGLNLVDFSKENGDIKLKNLEILNNKLSAFSSAKADSIQKEFVGYTQEVIDELRLIALISKGGHSFSRVNNRMKILAYYVENINETQTPSGVIPN